MGAIGLMFGSFSTDHSTEGASLTPLSLSHGKKGVCVCVCVCVCIWGCVQLPQTTCPPWSHFSLHGNFPAPLRETTTQTLRGGFGSDSTGSPAAHTHTHTHTHTYTLEHGKAPCQLHFQSIPSNWRRHSFVFRGEVSSVLGKWAGKREMEFSSLFSE